MAAITAKMVSDLREKTGAGMMDCKRALTAADGDMELAIENLRKSGIAKAEKKSGRSTNQGKVWTKVSAESGVIIEMLCETDFAAKLPSSVPSLTPCLPVPMPWLKAISPLLSMSRKRLLSPATLPPSVVLFQIILMHFVLPAIIAFTVSEIMRKKGMIKDGDMKLDI